MNFEQLKIRTPGLILPWRWNALIDAIAAATVRSFRGGTFVRSKAGTLLAVDRGGGGAVADDYPWKPDSVTALSFRHGPGFLSAFGKFVRPSNPNVVINVPPNSAAGWFSWVKLSLETSDETTSVSAAVIEQGASVPAGPAGDPDTGAPPAIWYIPLSYSTSNATAILRTIPLEKTDLQLAMYVQDITCGTKLRALTWGPFFNGAVES